MIQTKGKLSANDYDLISEGRFAPYSVSDEIIDKFYEERIILNNPNVAKEFPEIRLNEIYDNLILKSLKKSNVEEALKSDIEPIVEVEKPFIGKTSAIPNIINTKKDNLSTNVNVPNIGKAIATELLGGNIVDQAKNMQILQRRNQ